jgi:hypothetical protein
MTIYLIGNGGERCLDQDKFGVFTTLSSLPAVPGDIIILGKSPGHARCVEVEAVGGIGGLSMDFNVIKPKTICEFDLNAPAPVPGGAMKNAWEKGGAAFKYGHKISDYPGDKGTAPHKVWLKGYLWEYTKSL